MGSKYRFRSMYVLVSNLQIQNNKIIGKIMQTNASHAAEPSIDENKPVSPDWNEIRKDVTLAGHLNDSLRDKISGLKNLEPADNLMVTSVGFIGKVLGPLKLDSTALTPALTTLFDQQFKVYENADIPKPLRTRQYICGSGLIMSPDHCVTTVRDSMRVGLFLRGVDKAITQLLNEKFSHPLHVVYPACGPFAPLLLPLLAYYKNQGIYSAEDINITFVDIQEGAVLALESLVNKLGLGGYIRDIKCMDACKYETQEPVHLIVLEAMQHGFSREGHLRLAKHYAQLLHEKGIFLPKNISVTASLNIAQREYVDQWKNENVSLQKEIKNERVELGEVLNVDLAFLKGMKEQVVDEDTRLVECATLKIPQVDQGKGEQTLLFHTRVNVYGEDWLEEYESGITHPLPDSQVCVNFIPKDPRPGDLLVESGDYLTFYYCLNGLPGFLTTKASEVPTEAGGATLLGETNE